MATEIQSVITLTSAAAAEVKSMQANKPEDAGKPLRVFIERGGCSGMQYSMVFDEVRAGDAVVEQEGVKVVVDGFSLDYLRGTVVDFSDNLTSGGFKIRNPNASQTCGCGRSFESRS